MTSCVYAMGWRQRTENLPVEGKGSRFGFWQKCWKRFLREKPRNGVIVEMGFLFSHYVFCWGGKCGHFQKRLVLELICVNVMPGIWSVSLRSKYFVGQGAANMLQLFAGKGNALCSWLEAVFFANSGTAQTHFRFYWDGFSVTQKKCVCAVPSPRGKKRPREST